jgi:hypothetical protein
MTPVGWAFTIHTGIWLIMKYTIVLRKLLKELIGIITIVLFVYTCTKIRLAADHKKAAAHETIRPICVPAIRMPG